MRSMGENWRWNGFAATATYAPSGPSGRGELPPVLHQCSDEIANGEAFDSTDLVVVSEALDCQIRPSGRLQLNPKNACPLFRHSVRERVRACVRNAS